MISVEEARTRIVGRMRMTGAETVGLGEALGRVLVAPVMARLTQPPADVSAMDGFALRAADGARGAELRIIGAAPAGRPFAGTVGAGEAVRLFTGSVVPGGADSVVPQEDTSAHGDRLTLNEACAPGRHIRARGQDFAAGDALLPAGRKLTAREIGLAAAGNHPWLTVHRRPRVAILATGDEIVLPGEAIPAGGIVGGNAHMVAALVAQAGGEATILPIAADELGAIARGGAAAAGADLLLTIGGASVGDHDLVQAGLANLAVQFWKIAMRPGKPLLFGMIGDLPVLGLPGNSVSAFICALLFAGPAIERIGGLPGDAPALIQARLGAALKANDQREDYVRAELTVADGFWQATPLPTQDSAMLRSLVAAGGLIRRPPFDPARAAGEMVRVLRL